MSAETFPEALVTSLGSQMAVELAERGRETVGIAERERGAARIAHFDQVPEEIAAVVQPRLEDASSAVHRRNAATEVGQHRDLLGVRAVGPDDHSVSVRMDAQKRVRVRVRQIQEPPDLLVDLREGGGPSHVASSRSRAGMCTQSGRCPISYLSSYKSFSSSSDSSSTVALRSSFGKS